MRPSRLPSKPLPPRALASAGSRGGDPLVFWIDLVAAFGSPLRPQHIAETLPAEPARCDDPIMRYDPTATAPGRGAVHLTPACQPHQNILCPAAVSLPQFRGVKIGQADFNPLSGLGRAAHAEAITITDISNGSGERLTMPCREPSFARVSACYKGRRERKEGRGKDCPKHVL